MEASCFEINKYEPYLKFESHELELLIYEILSNIAPPSYSVPVNPKSEDSFHLGSNHVGYNRPSTFRLFKDAQELSWLS